jgi:PadR family transcriptional regulator AphA
MQSVTPYIYLDDIYCTDIFNHMDVKTLCLGVLSLGEASGYEIKKFFEDGFSHFYVAGFGSIYPALAQLTCEGHVTCSDIKQEKRPAKKVYRITDSGMALFRQELGQMHPRHKVRSDFLLQMIFAAFLTPQRLEEVLRLRSEDISAEIEHISEVQQRESLPIGTHFALGYARAVLQAGRDYINDYQEGLVEQLQTQGKSS